MSLKKISILWFPKGLYLLNFVKARFENITSEKRLNHILFISKNVTIFIIYILKKSFFFIQLNFTHVIADEKKLKLDFCLNYYINTFIATNFHASRFFSILCVYIWNYLQLYDINNKIQFWSFANKEISSKKN